MKQNPKICQSSLSFSCVILFLTNTLIIFWIFNSLAFTPHTDIAFQKFLTEPSVHSITSKKQTNSLRRLREPGFSRVKQFDNPLISFKVCKKRKSARDVFLCRINNNPFCKSKEPAELVSDFWVVAPIYSFDQQKSPLLYQLHNNFKDYMISFGLSFCTIEGIREDLNQSYIVTKPDNQPEDIQVVIYDEDYIRENLLNVAIRKLPKEWKYVAWIDAHQYFENSYWWEEAIIKMERNASVQLFQKGARLNTRNQTMFKNVGIMYLSMLQTSLDVTTIMLEYGNAYGIRRELYEQIGYIFDLCVATGCDLTYVQASIPETTRFSLLHEQHPYSSQFDYWINRTKSIFKGSRSYVRGSIFHFEHEHYINYWMVPYQYYQEGFNISTDLARDENFTIKIVNPKIRDIMPHLGLTFFFTP